MFDSMDAKTVESLLQNLGTIIGYVGFGVTAICVSKAKDWYSSRRSRVSTRKAASNSVLLSSFLSEIRALTDADRVSVMQFHNGDHFASGASVQKVTLTHCALRAGVSMPTNIGGESLATLPATMMSHVLSQAFEEGYALLSEKNEPADPWVQRYHIVNGVNTSVVCLIPGLNPQEAFGLLCFSWLEPTETSVASIDQMLVFARRASAYL